MNKCCVDYKKIYSYLNNYKRNIITASQLAFGIGVDNIYGASMMKLVREGYLETCPAKGFYKIVKRDC